MKPIPFFDQEIRIVPHTATKAEHVERSISIAEFAGDRCVRLYETESGDLLCQAVIQPYRVVDEFIEGPQV